MSSSAAFPIGVLSRKTGVNIETIRYYERAGLLPKPVRTSGGYRAYRPRDAQRLSFIRRTRDLGFSLDEVRRLLGLADQKSRSCRSVHAVAVKHLADIREKIDDLRRMEKVLSELAAKCGQGSMPACPLLEALNRSDEGCGDEATKIKK
jgi:MerR family mercuric resistance operon transcriptional regulator